MLSVTNYNSIFYSIFLIAQIDAYLASLLPAASHLCSILV